MGLETAIAQLKPKNLVLFQNIVAVGVIFTVVFGFFSILTHNMNVMAFLSSPDFVTIMLLMIVFGFAWKLLHGGKINIPDQSKAGNKPTFNIPDVYGVAKNKPQQTAEEKQVQQKRPHIKAHQQKSKIVMRGSWVCHGCGKLVIGTICGDCGTRRPFK